MSRHEYEAESSPHREGLTQVVLAFHSGVSPTEISKFENGMRGPIRDRQHCSRRCWAVGGRAARPPGGAGVSLVTAMEWFDVDDALDYLAVKRSEPRKKRKVIYRMVANGMRVSRPAVPVGACGCVASGLTSTCWRAARDRAALSPRSRLRHPSNGARAAARLKQRRSPARERARRSVCDGNGAAGRPRRYEQCNEQSI